MMGEGLVHYRWCYKPTEEFLGSYGLVVEEWRGPTPTPILTSS